MSVKVSFVGPMIAAACFAGALGIASPASAEVVSRDHAQGAQNSNRTYRTYQLGVENTSPATSSYVYGSINVVKDWKTDPTSRRIAPQTSTMKAIGDGEHATMPPGFKEAEYSIVWFRTKISSSNPDYFDPEDYVGRYQVISGVDVNNQQIMMIRKSDGRDPGTIIRPGQTFTDDDVPLHPEQDPRTSCISITFTSGQQRASLLRANVEISYRMN